MNPTQAEAMEALDHAFEAYEEYGNQEALDELHEAIEGVRAYLQASGEPVGYTGSGSLAALSKGADGYIWPTPADAHPIPLHTNPQPAPVTTRWQHRKRGTVYTEIGRGLLQCAANPALDDQPVVIYQGEDGKLWVRGVSEFEDGRFYRLSTAIGERG